MVEHDEGIPCALQARRLSASLCHHLLPTVKAVLRRCCPRVNPLPRLIANGSHPDKASHGRSVEIGLFAPNLLSGTPKRSNIGRLHDDLDRPSQKRRDFEAIGPRPWPSGPTSAPRCWAIRGKRTWRQANFPTQATGWCHPVLNLAKTAYFRKPCQIGADERTRTFTPVKEQRPQRCASTNSATSALI